MAVSALCVVSDVHARAWQAAPPVMDWQSWWATPMAKQFWLVHHDVYVDWQSHGLGEESNTFRVFDGARLWLID